MGWREGEESGRNKEMKLLFFFGKGKRTKKRSYL
jgi:hypothetical protein